MPTTPRLLSLLLILPLLPFSSGCSPDAKTADQHEDTPSLTVDKDAQAGLLTTFHATTQQLAAARPALSPDQEAARQLVLYHRGALALTAAEAHRGRDSTLLRWAAAFAQDQQQQLPEAEALAVRLKPGAADSAFGQRLRSTVAQLVKVEEATRVEAAGRQRQAPNLGMMQSHQDDGTGDTDADFATLLLLQQRAALETARAAEELGSAPELKAAAAGMQRRAQPFIRQLQLWQQRHRPRS